MKRGRKFILFGALAAVVAIAVEIGWTWLAFSDLEKAVWKRASGESLEVSDIAAWHLPNDFEGALETLRKADFVDVTETLIKYDFVERDPVVGATYRRVPVPKYNGSNRIERGVIERFNRVLHRHGAVSAKLFERRIPRLGLVGSTRLRVYLMLTSEGATKIYARTYFKRLTYFV